MVKVKLSLRGCGTTIVKGCVDNELWQNLQCAAKKARTNIELGLFDSDLFKVLNHPDYKSWRNFNSMLEITGLSDNRKSFIEIKVDNKTKEKIQFSDIQNNNLLFPLYNTETILIETELVKSKIISVVESDIGLVASYKFATPNFIVEDLRFFIGNVIVGNLQYSILYKIFYQNKLLISSMNDSVVTYALIEN
ncbi:MAG: hypothetical protein ABI723_19770 [Bacteroidia bacterium]